ncbi:hypothetical protein GRI58_13500 [Porphyrobacter algicida]|uniref:Uncharacterized protein n=1 Tax=Qipengyuania algicida TaxID=1836209 RepID=A0A845AJN3_9SPHN|nr:hypothetical protein [Qipengyuania algicida]MXP29824.1 hypothetical protein [Qipengyuania algicida]
MKKLTGPNDGRRKLEGKIIDAEWEDVDDEAPSIGDRIKQKFKNVAMVVGVIVLGLWVIGMMTTSPDGNNSSNNSPPSDDAAAGPTRDWLVGAWVMTPKGGSDGKTACSDFNAPGLEKLNRHTAKALLFTKDGTYKSFFTYRAPTKEEHYQGMTAQYQLDGDTLELSNVNVTEPFGGVWQDESFQLVAKSSNVMTLSDHNGTVRFVRCQGNASGLFDFAPASQASASDQPSQSTLDTQNLGLLCSDQRIIDQLHEPFAKAVRQALIVTAAQQSADTRDDAVALAWINANSFTKLNFVFRDITSLGVGHDDANRTTVRCRAKLRIAKPMAEADGVFSSYTQFNDAYYTLKLDDPGDLDSKIFLLAEIRPVNGKLDVTTGTE